MNRLLLGLFHWTIYWRVESREYIASGCNASRREWAVFLQDSGFFEVLDQFRPLFSIVQVRHAGPIGARLLGE